MTTRNKIEFEWVATHQPQSDVIMCFLRNKISLYEPLVKNSCNNRIVRENGNLWSGLRRRFLDIVAITPPVIGLNW